FWGAWMMPLVLACTWLLMRALPHIDPRRDNYLKFMGAYETIIIAVMLLLLGVHVMVLASATGRAISLERVLPAGLGLLFIVVGAVLPRVHPNWFVGIRTPWTLSSDLSWERTHRVGGYLFMAVGTITVLTALVAPALTFKILFCAALVVVVFVFVYSYVVWKNDPARSTT
ncbi:MAG TPA: SdpI family protein, partial [Gemmatimonadaceae bacterium]|nr:SdpI family protein [Gemmatimonadaceae bacterium]